MFKIKRLEFGATETLGVLTLKGKILCYTLELAWKDNARNVSCIPIGTYTCKRVQSPKFGEVWQILDVPNRSNILIHAGNTHKQIEGCVLLGSGVGWLDNDRAVLNSRGAINEFHIKTKEFDSLSLEIT